MDMLRSLDEDHTAVFTINGEIQRVGKEIDVETSLNSYIRNNLGLTGTKVMCREGSCGSCVVYFKFIDPISKKETSMPINSCLLPVLGCHGASITTIEGIGSRMKGYNKIQTTLAHFNGTQCGFCSPGFVMTMYSELKRNPSLTTEQVENLFSGNLCRCTGYRPILDAFKSLASDPPARLKKKLLEIEESHMLCPRKGVCKEENNCTNCFMASTEECSLDFLELSFANEKLSINDGSRKWYRVTTVKEIFEIWDQIENESYVLVNGATSKGVTVRTRSDSEVDPKVYIDIRGVKELKTVVSSDDSFTFGSGLTLDKLMEKLLQLSNNKKFAYAKQMVNHLKLVANVPVRNLATVGGNLSFCNQHKDFPSDIFLLLDAVSANITIASKSGTVKTYPMSEFRSLDLHKKVILNITLVPTSSQLKSYKVMESAQNSPAVINGAFLYDVSNEGIIREKPNIIFSGISDLFRHAAKTETYLKGKNIFDKNVLKGSLKILSDEIHPDINPWKFSPEYRKQLALSLFYRSILSLNLPRVEDKYKGGSEPIKRFVSSGKQVYYTNKEEWPLTQPVPKLEAQIQCSGEAKYTKDLTDDDTLFGKFVLSDAIGEIENIDGTKALEMKGVLGFYTAKDIPGTNNVFYPTEKGSYEFELLSSGTTLYHGQPIALLVAVDELTATRAIKLVKVTYKNIKTNILVNIKDVLSSKEQDRIAKVDSFQPSTKPGDAKYKFSGELELGGQYAHAMETHTTLVIPRENGQLKIKSATQAITFTLIAISNITSVPLSKLECSVTRIGGAYGSKVISQAWNAAGAALGAVKLNKSVKMSFTLPEEMTVIGKRTSTLVKYQGGIDENGKIQGLDISVYYNMGCKISSIYSTIIPYLRYIINNCYDYSTWAFTTYTVKTDLPPASILRSPCFVSLYSLTEQIMDHAAFVSKLDPINVRINNAGDQFIIKHISDWRTSTDFDERKVKINQYNKDNRWKKKGLSLCCMRYPFDYYFRNIGCSVSILFPDGTVQIVHGGTEMGQGINTKVSQIVAHELGVDLSNVQVLATSSKVTPNNHESVASVTGELASYAALKCCQDLKERIQPVRNEMKNATWKELVKKLYFSGINLNANYLSGISKDKSELKNYNVYGVAVTETEIDVLTGERKISRVDILEDVGKSLSPEIDVGQVEGAYIMGVGYITNERILPDNKTGAILNNTLWNYKIPTSKDIPEDFRVTFVPNSTSPGSVLGSKAVGEPSLALSVGVINSFRNALMSARHDSGLSDEWIRIDSPCTIESVLMKSGTTEEQLTF